MDTSSYIMLSRQMGLFEKMGAVANNIANSNTDGFRKEQMVFEEFLAGAGVDNRDVSFSRNVATHADTSQGPLKVTGRSLDAAIDGQGYFAVQTDIGERYTRVGRFHINHDNTLVTDKGQPVLADGEPIIFQPGDTGLEFKGDGTITVVGASGLREPRAVLDIVRFEDDQLMKKIAGNLYSTDQRPVRSEPFVDYRIHGGKIEGSNVNSTQQLTEMMTVSRAVGATSGFMNDVHEMYQRAVNTIGRQY